MRRAPQRTLVARVRFVPFADEALSFDASFLRRMDVLARRRGG